MSELADLIFKVAQRGRAMNATRAYIGMDAADGSTTIDVPGRASDVYVTRRGNGNATVSVVEFRGGARIAGYPVIIEVDPLTGREYTSAPNSAEATRFLGDDRPITYAPPHGWTHSPEGGDVIQVSTRQMLSGLVYSVSGLVVKVEEFPFLDFGRVRILPESTIDLASYLPATAGKSAWVIVCINAGADPATLIAVEGSEQSVIGSLTKTTIEDVNILGYIPLIAVQLSEGQTASPTERNIYELRTLTRRDVPLCNYTATAAPGVGDDSADGYGVGSHWYDTTNDAIYACIDASAGAAVWRRIDLRVQYSTANVSNPPTAAELAAEFGATATVGTNFIALLNDNGASSNTYAVLCDGTDYYTVALTKAV